jgi:Bacterial transcriptional activator domain
VGFTVTLGLICVGLGLGLAASMAAGGQPDLGGSLITALACGLAALAAAYGLGVLVSQLTPSARAGKAVAALVVVALYVLTNVWEELGAAGAIRFVSPFFYFNQSRALVPGEGLDLAASLALLAMAAVLLGAAAWAYQGRDYAAGLWARRPRQARPVRRGQPPVLHTIWGATLVRHRLGLLTWAGAAAATLALMAWLEPTVEGIWDEFGLTRTMIGDDPGLSVADQYLSFAAQLLASIIAAYVITQAAGWVGDLHDGRVELLLAGPLSWAQLVWQRLLALLVGVAIITIAAIIGLVAARHAQLDPAVAAALAQAGEAYGGVLLDGAPYAWAEVPREEVRRRAVDALARLAELRQGAGDQDGALSALEQAVAADPVAEELYRRVMRLEAEVGRPDAVRRPTGCWPGGWPTWMWILTPRPSSWSPSCCAARAPDRGVNRLPATGCYGSWWAAAVSRMRGSVGDGDGGRQRLTTSTPWSRRSTGFPWPSSLPPVTGWSGNCGPLATARPPVAWLRCGGPRSALGGQPARHAGHDRHVERSRRRLRIAQLIERRGRGPCSLGPRRRRRQSQELPGCHLR